jgi:CRISPR-associated protein Csd2
MTLSKKIDFALIIEVNHANPNGDPLNGNRPRTDFGGFGEITDVCLKRKLRDRLQDAGQAIFVQSDDRKKDGMTSLKNRATDSVVGLGDDAFKFDAKKGVTPEATAKKACLKWFDVRAFGQVFAWSAEKPNRKGSQKDATGDSAEGATSNANGVSIPIRGPLTIQSAFSVDPVSVSSTQITKSVSGEGNGTKRGSDTMGMKHRVDKGIYVTFGAITPQLAERTGFSDADAQVIKSLLPKLFEGDASSARPEGSICVLHWFWWEQDGKTPKYSSAKVHRSLKVNSDGTFEITDLDGLKPESGDGF